MINLPGSALAATQSARAQVAPQMGLAPPPPPQLQFNDRGFIGALASRFGIGRPTTQTELQALRSAAQGGYGVALNRAQDGVEEAAIEERKRKAAEQQQQFQNELLLRREDRADSAFEAKQSAPGLTPYQELSLRQAQERIENERSKQRQIVGQTERKSELKRLDTVRENLDAARGQSRTASRALQLIQNAPPDLIFGPTAEAALAIDKARAAAGNSNAQLLNRIAAGEQIVALQNAQFVANSGPLKGALSNKEGDRSTRTGAGLGDSRTGALFKAEMAAFTADRAQQRLEFIADQIEGDLMSPREAEREWERTISDRDDKQLQAIIDKYTKRGSDEPASPAGSYSPNNPFAQGLN